MNRRSFLGALAVVMAAPRTLAKLVAPDRVTATEVRAAREAFINGLLPPSRQWFTLQEWHDRIDPNGAPARLARMLNTRNEVLDSLVWKDA